VRFDMFRLPPPAARVAKESTGFPEAAASDYLILKRASASGPSGEWNDEDYDSPCGRRDRRPHHEGGGSAGRAVMDVDAGF
jgi:hypothetical protein